MSFSFFALLVGAVSVQSTSTPPAPPPPSVDTKVEGQEIIVQATRSNRRIVTNRSASK